MPAGATSFAFMGLHVGRIVLIVTDFETSLAFYRDVVGLELSEEPQENWATFKTGDATLSIAGPFPDMPYDPKSLGDTPDQIMFEVDDIDGAVAELRARGVSVGEPFTPGGEVLLAEFRDPAPPVQKTSLMERSQGFLGRMKEPLGPPARGPLRLATPVPHYTSAPSNRGNP